MKYLKVIAVAVVAMFAVEGAKAQVVVNAHIGTTAPRRTVVVERPVARTVVVERPVERRVVVIDHYHRRRPRYRETVVVERNHQYRRHVAVRHY
jgi:hypothetical protein